MVPRERALPITAKKKAAWFILPPVIVVIFTVLITFRFPWLGVVFLLVIPCFLLVYPLVITIRVIDDFVPEPGRSRSIALHLVLAYLCAFVGAYVGYGATALCLALIFRL